MPGLRVLRHYVLLAAALGGCAVGAEKPFDPESHRTIRTDRADGRYMATRGYVQTLLRSARPKLAFNPDFSRVAQEAWKRKVRLKIRELMRFPVLPPQPPPKMLWMQKRSGYRLEKWEGYPLPGGVVPFLLLVPDAATARNPAPAVLCLPGSLGSKESLAGEPELEPQFARAHPDHNRMALLYAQKGMVALALDNPGTAETSDLVPYAQISDQRDTLARYLLDMGWHYLGLSAYQANDLLNWLKGREYVDRRRMALSGHSLGTEPLMVLAALDPDVRAIVFNDFLGRLIQRAAVVTKPSASAVRPRPNWLGHCVPGLWEWLDYPDLVASFAPTPLILCEGGADRDLDLIRTSYRTAGAPGNLAIHYYPKFAEPQKRRDNRQVPEGLDEKEWLDHMNVDAANHYFKWEAAVPWLAGRLGVPPR